MNGAACRALIAAIALSALGAWIPAAAGAASLKDWVSGPIRYIAEADEMKLFKKLKRDEDRALFIDRFWARRDPSPGTLTNEYRQLFWERVREANDLFLDSPREGWRTDRGKIHVLYGPPNEKEEELNLATDGLAASGHGLIRWIYEGRAGGRNDVNPVVVVPFVRDATGEYRISYDPRLASVFFDALAIKEKRYEGIDRFFEIMGGPRKTDLSVMLDLGKLQEVPPQTQVLLERVETIETYRTRDIVVELSRFRHPDKRGTLVVVTVDASYVEEGERPAILARFSTKDATEAPRTLGEDSFRLVEGSDRVVAQGRLVLDPGEYEVTVLVTDPSTADTGLYRTSLRATVPAEGLDVSDTVLAAEIESLPYASLSSHDEPYHVGPFRVVPRLSESFTPGEPFRLFFEIYGGRAPYSVRYQLEGLDVDGTWVALGQPTVRDESEASQAWELATSSRWPLGEYRVSVLATDADGKAVSRLVPFRLEDDGTE